MKAGTGLALLLLSILSTPALAETNLRDPFARIQPARTAPSRPEISVTGLMQSGDHYLAIVRYDDESRIVQVGDWLAGSRVLKISPEGVTLLSPGEAQHVRLGEKEVTLSFEYAWNYGLEAERVR